jgi:hypothetical protein
MGYGLGDRISILGRGNTFLFPQNIQTSYGAYAACFLNGKEKCLLEGKADGP